VDLSVGIRAIDLVTDKCRDGDVSNVPPNPDGCVSP